MEYCKSAKPYYLLLSFLLLGLPLLDYHITKTQQLEVVLIDHNNELHPSMLVKDETNENHSAITLNRSK